MHQTLVIVTRAQGAIAILLTIRLYFLSAAEIHGGKHFPLWILFKQNSNVYWASPRRPHAAFSIIYELSHERWRDRHSLFLFNKQGIRGSEKLMFIFQRARCLGCLWPRGSDWDLTTAWLAAFHFCSSWEKLSEYRTRCFFAMPEQ